MVVVWPASLHQQVAQISNSGRPRHYPLREMVSDCYESAGVKWIPNSNAGDPIEYCKGAQNTYQGKRNYAANCFKLGENVIIYNHVLTEIEGNKVVGVKFSRKDPGRDFETFVTSARKEVLICSGVQGSAKLLLLK
ncbi:hypothetical protein BDZ45DRAFT_356400 [Acephala macrosclerotiorum]|nr:hypothetical protein BDZ45DRAFT_356400 [Acephala macrosclerotiorum]